MRWQGSISPPFDRPVSIMEDNHRSGDYGRGAGSRRARLNHNVNDEALYTRVNNPGGDENNYHHSLQQDSSPPSQNNSYIPPAPQSYSTFTYPTADSQQGISTTPATPEYEDFFSPPHPPIPSDPSKISGSDSATLSSSHLPSSDQPYDERYAVMTPGQSSPHGVASYRPMGSRALSSSTYDHTYSDNAALQLTPARTNSQYGHHPHHLPTPESLFPQRRQQLPTLSPLPSHRPTLSRRADDTSYERRRDTDSPPWSPVHRRGAQNPPPARSQHDSSSSAHARDTKTRGDKMQEEISELEREERRRTRRRGSGDDHGLRRSQRLRSRDSRGEGGYGKDEAEDGYGGRGNMERGERGRGRGERKRKRSRGSTPSMLDVPKRRDERRDRDRGQGGNGYRRGGSGMGSTI